MRSWRLLRSISRWDKYTAGQLKDELAMRGLKRSGSKSDLIKRLEACEVMAPPPGKPPDPELPGETQRKALGKELLIAEIKKRRPDEPVNSRYPKEKLVEMLNQLLETADSAASVLPSIRSLLPRLNSSLSIGIGEALEVAEVLVDLEKVEQNELNVLINSDIVDFYRLWSLLYGGLEAMNGKQLMTVLRLIHLFSEILKKPPTTGSPALDSSSLSLLAQCLRQFQSSLSILDLAAASTLLSQLSSSKSATDVVSAFQNEVLRRLQTSESLNLPLDQLFMVFESLPEAAFSVNSSAVSKLISTLFAVNSRLSSARVLASLHKFYHIKAPVPFSLTVRVAALGKDFLKRLHPVSLYDVLRLACEQRCLTVGMVRTVWEM